MSLIRKHVAVLQAWACLDLVYHRTVIEHHIPDNLRSLYYCVKEQFRQAQVSRLLGYDSCSQPVRPLTLIA